MRARIFWMAAVLLAVRGLTLGQQPDPTPPRTITLHEAVEMALQHNHAVRIASLHVEEEQQAKQVARSRYFPGLRNDTSYAHLTDTQFIQIPGGAFGNGIPTRPTTINQGGRSLFLSGTQVTQPLGELFKIRSGVDVAQADLTASREKARGTENAVALKVRQLYHKILVVQSEHDAIAAKIRAVNEQQGERVQQVKFGSALDVDLIESRAQSLQAKQELLTADLQLSDLRMQFNDVIGLPIKSAVELDPNVQMEPARCQRDQCLKLALDSHPEIAEARAEVDKATAGVREAKREYIPDVEAFARYSHQNDSVPFLASNFGTFGIHVGYDAFDGGKKLATLRERNAQLAQAKENLARIRDEVEIRVQTAYNKLERTQQMVAVSQELLATRKEGRRVSAEQLARGAFLRSQADTATAQEMEAETLFLQAQLDYIQAQDELDEAVGLANE
jgi:outer membrane protein TolC